MEDMVEHGVVEISTAEPGMIINPLGVVIKGSDIQRAKSLVNIEVKCSHSLRRASEALVQAGHPRIKCRISTDCTGSGINEVAYSPAFQYSTVSDGLRVVSRNGYLSTGDVSRYFFEFPWSIDVRKLFCFVFMGQLYHYLRLCFGFTSCPYYCSTWSAEFGRRFAAMGIAASFLMDDWLVGGHTAEEAKSKMDTISDTLTKVGFTMAKEKNKLGQQVTWLGILIDSTTMSMRIDPTQAEGFRAQLQVYETNLLLKRNLDLTTLRHISGKLNWYAEIINAGRLHIRSLWKYTASYPEISEIDLNSIIKDIRWWKSKLEAWSMNQSTGLEYKILNGQEILDHPESIHICQSDASGTDGFGYAWSTLSEEGYQWFSSQWPEHKLPTQSHEAELRSLQHFVETRITESDALIIWITDSESACWTINRGHCADPIALPIVETILNKLDDYKIQVVALWVPREENTLTDFLSHFACLLDRDSITGSQESTSVGTFEGDPNPN
jgi:hypothetical protein